MMQKGNVRRTSPVQDGEEQREASRRFGRWLQAQLDRRGWTQAELARRSGVSRSQISAYINGQFRPEADSARRIADALYIDVQEVLYHAGQLPEALDQSPLRRQLIRLAERMPESQLRNAVRLLEAMMQEED